MEFEENKNNLNELEKLNASSDIDSCSIHCFHQSLNLNMADLQKTRANWLQSKIFDCL